MVEEDKPPIPESIDDLLTRVELADWMGVNPRHVLELIYGDPPLPFFRYSNKMYRFSKKQVMWWFMKFQGKVDPMIVDIRRAKREARLARAKGRKS